MSVQQRGLEGELIHEYTEPVNIPGVWWMKRTFSLTTAKANNRVESSRSDEYVAAHVGATLLVNCPTYTLLSVRAGLGGTARVDHGDFTVARLADRT